MKDYITTEGRDGTFGAYIARPKSLPAPAVVNKMQELFGVNADIRKTCDELAGQGFLAVAPDLFWRQEPGADLSTSLPSPTGNSAFAFIRAYDRDSGARDVKDATNVAANLPECSGKVAVLAAAASAA